MECILLKFHWGMKALIELHFQHEALPRFIENVYIYIYIHIFEDTIVNCLVFRLWSQTMKQPNNSSILKRKTDAPTY